MKRIILIALLLFVGRESAWAGACEENLGNAFTPNQRVVLCTKFGDAISNSLIPSADATYDLGTSALSWRTAYLDTSLINTGSAFEIKASTSDAADSATLAIAGGGDNLETRGSHIFVSGNESASTGALSLNGGNIATSHISTSINHASALIRFFNASGGRTVYLDNSGNVNFDATNGGDLILNKSGSGISIQENSASTACMGTSAPNGTTPVVVTTSCATSGARIFYSRNGAVTNNASISTTTAPNGTSFSFASTNGSDTGGASVVWLIVKESA